MIKSMFREHKETIHNFFWRALQIFSKQGISIIVFLMAATILTPLDFGILGYLTAATSLLLILAEFGIATSTNKTVAELNIKNPDRINKIFFTVSAVITSLNIIIITVIILFGKNIFASEFTYILLFIPYIFFIPLISVLDGIYRGTNQFKKLSLITIILGVLQIAIAYILLNLYGLKGVIISQNIYALLLLITLYFFCEKIQIGFDKEILKKILKYSIVIGISSCMFYLYTQADILILKYYGYIVEIGYYNLVTKIFSLIILPFMILGQSFANKNTEHYISRRQNILLQSLKKQILTFFILGIAISIFTYLALPILLKYFLPKYFVFTTILMLNLLLLILPIKIVAAIVNHGHTIPTGNAHFSLWTMIPAGILNVLLDFYFINTYGFIGVIYATLISNTFGAISFMIPYYLKLKKISLDPNKYEVD